MDKDIERNWHKDSKNWRFIFFYYNPEDSRLMVEKRSKWAGITLNYAHKTAWFWTIVIFLFIGLLIYFLPSN